VEGSSHLDSGYITVARVAGEVGAVADGERSGEESSLVLE